MREYLGDLFKIFLNRTQKTLFIGENLNYIKILTYVNQKTL